ncbi:MAG TPA: response regulator [Sphingomicrobium sp.]|nr:response regulator [Sphingomicrobium sp.]
MTRPLIHLVDDDSAVRGTLARVLASGGYRVREYASGRELLDSAERLEEGCILLDINMPGPDGFAVHKALSDKAIGLPVVMMTGSGDLTLLALKAGVADFMQKPFGRSELLSVLDQLCAEQPAGA